MKSIVFICPYFGTLPKQHMELWLQSCSKNTDINWLIFTDDHTEYCYPENVKVEYMSFQEMKEYIQDRFKFKVNIEKPYKLCDFKPIYGYVFSEYVKEYDYWGHCDMSDCIFGNLRKFLNEDILNQNDKIGFLGHMTLYRNTENVNKRFLLKTKSGVPVEQILGVSENKAFDELNTYSINTIYKEYNFKMARVDEAYVDISPMRYAFQASKYDAGFIQYYDKKEPMIFEWNNGQLFECTVLDGQVQKREIAYVHFQKRKMDKKFIGVCGHYYIVPNKFIDDLESLDVQKIKCYSKDRLYSVFFKLKWDALKYHIGKIGQLFEEKKS